MAQPQFGLLGPLLVRRGDVLISIPAGKQRVLLAALLLAQGRAISADELAGLLWESGPPPSGRVTVHNYVKRLRQALLDSSRALVTTQADGYLLRVPADDLDISRFEEITARARQARQAGQHAQASDGFRTALSLWRGRPLADVPCDQLIVRHVSLLEELRWQVLEERIEADLHCGLQAELLTELRALVDAEPFRERLRSLLMLTLYLEGRQADALAAFQEARRVLIEEIGVEPGPELRRLHERMLNSDPALAADAVIRLATPAAPAMIPRQLPPAVAHFIGREQELAQLETITAQAGETAVAVIVGTAGAGKTALATQWAHRAAGHFPDGQLYINLRGFDPETAPMSPTEGLGVFIESLQPSAPVPNGLSARVNLYRSLTADKRMLIVLDNARHGDQVRPLLPGSPGCMVLITSRDRLTGLAATEGAQLIPIGVLTAADARALITARVGSARGAAEPAALAEIAELCGRLPLALAVAAAKASARPALPLADLAAELRDPEGRLDALDAGEFAACARSVFSWSYASLTGRAAELFRLLGLHPGPDAGVKAAASLMAVPAAQARGMLDELTRSNVIAEPIIGRFALHDLLREYARERVHADESADQRRAATHRMIDYYLHTAHAMSLQLYPARAAITLVPPSPGVAHEELGTYQQAWTWAETEYPVLLAMTALASNAGFPGHAWQLAWSLETFLSRRGRWDELGDIQRIALRAARTAGDMTGQAHARCGLGWTCMLRGQYDLGRAHLEEAVRLFHQIGDKSGEARARIRVGTAFWRQDRYLEARQSAQLALELFGACGDRAGQAGALNNIGLLHIKLGEYEHGLDCCNKGLAMFREIGYRRGEANALDSLGEAYRRLGRTANAVAYFRESLSAFCELGDQYNQAEILTHLATAHQADGGNRAAQACLRQALAILTELKHPDSVKVSGKLRELD
jgi:DNA-binding SARP family transcriptional activator/tetratricopeptide (TPR) repeat protein